MNRKYNLKLDLQFRCNNSTMKFNQFDNNTSDFFIKISNGGKSFDVEKAIVVLAVIKPSGKVASQFVEVENGLVYADLKPNMRDETGIYTAQAMLILEDERVVTDVISYEVEEDKIFSLLNDTVGTSEEFTLLTDMLSRLSAIEISEEQRVINEAERILSEENRKIEEAKRVEAELIRQHEEADRAKYDATRESNENIRKINEEARISSENVRLENEANRIEQEANRVKAEQLRKDNYNLMTEDEERRRSEANAHKEAEVLRVQAETNRVNEEAKRRTTEQARVSAENTRVSNENTRKANETTRQTNETHRVEAETQRQNRYNSFILEAEANANNFENYTNNAKIKEEERKSNELNRKSQEDRRVSNEVERISNENARIESEKQRVDAENLRKEKIVEIQSDYDSLKKVIIDENASANLQNQINQTNSQLAHNKNELDSKINDLNVLKATKNELDVERKRIDSFTRLEEGSTTGDAELIDAREGADGVTYNNIGSAIRTQFERINSSMYDFTKGENILEHISMIPATQLNSADGETYSWDSISCSPFIPVEDIKYAVIGTNNSYSDNVLVCCYYDENKRFLGSGKTQGNPGEYYYHEGQKFIRFSTNTSSVTGIKGIIPYKEGVHTYDVRNDVYKELYLKKEEAPNLIAPLKSDIANVNNKVSDITITEYRNICNSAFEDGSLNHSTGLPQNDSSYCRMKDYVSVIGGKEIWFVRGSSVGPNVQDVFEYDYNYGLIKVTRDIYNQNHTGHTNKITLHEDTRFIKTCSWFTGSEEDSNIEYAIYYTETGITRYEPYSNPSITIKKEYMPKETIKPIVVFNFDLTNIDERYHTLQKYGYTGTWQVGEGAVNYNREALNTLIQSGHDLSPYAGLLDEEYKDTSNHEANITKLAEKIQTLLDDMKQLGEYNPVMWSCARHRGGYVVSEAVKKFPFKYIRCSWGVDENGEDYYINPKCEAGEIEQFPLVLGQVPTFAQAKQVIDTRIADKCSIIMPMCHTLEYDNITEPNYFENLVAYVKQLEDEGIVEVMNMREYYERHFPIQGARDDRTRLMSAINDIRNLSLA